MNTVPTPMKSKRCPPTLGQLPKGYPLKSNPINRALKVVQKIKNLECFTVFCRELTYPTD